MKSITSRMQKGITSLKRSMKAAVVAAPLLCAAVVSQAQCLTDFLTINTGYTSAGVIGVGAPDPHWNITSISPALAALVVTPPTPYPAPRATFSSWSATDPNSTWLSFDNPSTWYTTTSATADYSFIVARNFTLCQDDDIKFDLKMSFDNWVRTVKIDGITIYTGTPTSSFSAVSTFTAIPVSVMSLTSGTHTIEADVVNFHTASVQNPHGFQMVGIIGSATGNTSIVNDNECPDYVCQDDCDDKCFWKLKGNNILGGNNIFGTLSPDNVRIKTSNLFRGVMDTKGQLGWNTMSPTAYLHVLCTGNNDDKGGKASDIRFEKLEPGKGNILVIDDQGYVYNSHMPIDAAGKATAADNAALANRVAELEAQVRQLTAMMKATGSLSADDQLEQNVPNPTGRETSIGYYIRDIKTGAYLTVYDMSGKEVMRFDISESGRGTVNLDCSKLLPGNYLYSLLVDGRRVDSKKMVIRK